MLNRLVGNLEPLLEHRPEGRAALQRIVLVKRAPAPPAQILDVHRSSVSFFLSTTILPPCEKGVNRNQGLLHPYHALRHTIRTCRRSSRDAGCRAWTKGAPVREPLVLSVACCSSGDYGRARHFSPAGECGWHRPIPGESAFCLPVSASMMTCAGSSPLRLSSASRASDGVVYPL